MKLTVLSGPSGSGKSTRAAELAGAAPWRIVSSDRTRERLPQLSPDQVTLSLIRSAGMLLECKCEPIVDACNLHPHDRLRWETVAQAFDAELDWIEMDTPIEECVLRDAQRDDPVGSRKILLQYEVHLNAR